MRTRLLLIVLLIAVLSAWGCVDKKEQPAPEQAQAVEQAVEAPTEQNAKPATPVEQLAGQLQPSTEIEATADIDQGTPEAALQSFFVEVNIALNPMYQMAAQQEPEQAKRYTDALGNLRSLFMDGASRTEIVAYLDLIQIKRAEVLGDAAVDGDKAQITVKVIKGDNLQIDPRMFGEDSATEATVEVEMVRIDGKWRIKDFGGLVAKAKSSM